MGDLNSRQEEILKEEMRHYEKQLQNLTQEERKAKIVQMLTKIAEGFKVYNVVRNNEKLDSLISDFTQHTEIPVYVFSYVEDAFLNNIFQRLSLAYYSVVRKEGIKLSYKFVKVKDGEESLFYITAFVESDITLDNSTELIQSAQPATEVNQKYFKGKSFNIYGDASFENNTYQSAKDLLEKYQSSKLPVKGTLKLYALNFAEEQTGEELTKYDAVKIFVRFPKAINVEGESKEGVEYFFNALFSHENVKPFIKSGVDEAAVILSDKSYWSQGLRCQKYEPGNASTEKRFDVSYGYIYKYILQLSSDGNPEAFIKYYDIKYSDPVLFSLMMNLKKLIPPIQIPLLPGWWMN